MADAALLLQGATQALAENGMDLHELTERRDEEIADSPRRTRESALPLRH